MPSDDGSQRGPLEDRAGAKSNDWLRGWREARGEKKDQLSSRFGGESLEGVIESLFPRLLLSLSPSSFTPTPSALRQDILMAREEENRELDLLVGKWILGH